MLNVEIDQDEGIAILEPDGELTERDFSAASRIIDPYIEKSGELKGIIIYVKSFPGWDSFSALIAHLKFVREHHKKVAQIAFVTDSPLGSVAEKIAGHFVNAEIKNFVFSEFEDSKKWMVGR